MYSNVKVTPVPDKRHSINIWNLYFLSEFGDETEQNRIVV